MEMTLFQVGKQAILPETIKHPPHRFHLTLALVLGIDEDVIQVHDNEDIKLFCQDLIDITLEAGRSVW